MYEPNFKLTTKLSNSLREIEDVRDLLRQIPVIHIVEEPLQHRALVETVYYTARIEGNPLDIKAVERLRTLQSPKAEIDKDTQEHLNLYKAMDFIKYIAGQTDVPIDEEVIKQIHTFIVRDIPSDGPSGVYKVGPNAIIDRVTRERIFLPPSPTDTIRFMRELSDWLSQKPLAFHPVITAGLAHLELVALHPFNNGNGRTARALSDLILYRYGYALRYLFSWVRQVGIDMGTYHQKLREALGPQYGANVDPTIWLEYFTESVAKSLLEKKSYLLNMRDTFTNAYNFGEEQGLSRDQVEAIIYTALEGYITTGTYMRATKLSRATVVKRLNHLVEAGIMKVVGRGRGVHYVLVPTDMLKGEEQRTEGTQLRLIEEGSAR